MTAVDPERLQAVIDHRNHRQRVWQSLAERAERAARKLDQADDELAELLRAEPTAPPEGLG